MDEGLVALDIDDAVHVGRAAQLLEGLVEAVGAAGVVGAGEHGLAPEIQHVAQDARVVGGHHHAVEAGLPGLAHHAGNHAEAAKVDERLAGQAGGSVAGGNEAEDHTRQSKGKGFRDPKNAPGAGPAGGGAASWAYSSLFCPRWLHGSPHGGVWNDFRSADFYMTGFFLLLTMALHGPAALPPPALAPADSIGEEMRSGQRFVRHRVSPGETLSALARRYGVSLGQLIKSNPQIVNGLGIGQVVLVPRPLGSPLAEAPAKTTKAAGAKGAAGKAGAAPGRYTVAKGDNLYAIARRFQVSPDELIKLNGLPADGRVRLGQRLLLGPGPAAAAAPALAAGPKPAPRPAEPEAVPPAAPAAPAADKPAQVATVTPATPADKEADKAAEKVEKFERKAADRSERSAERAPTRASELVARVTESGLAATIDNSGTDKYLALHKTAPVGTIMQVKNAMNGQSVYVRVIGKLPDTGENNNILVRLSPRAVQKLGTADQRFRVETSYVP